MDKHPQSPLSIGDCTSKNQSTIVTEETTLLHYVGSMLLLALTERLSRCSIIDHSTNPGKEHIKPRSPPPAR